jgi:hypothetical protein
MNKRKLPDSMVAAPADVKAHHVVDAIVADGVCIPAAEPIAVTPPRKVIPKGSPADSYQQLQTNQPTAEVHTSHHVTLLH